MNASTQIRELIPQLTAEERRSLWIVMRGELQMIEVFERDEIRICATQYEFAGEPTSYWVYFEENLKGVGNNLLRAVQQAESSLLTDMKDLGKDKYARADQIGRALTKLANGFEILRDLPTLYDDV